jgi:antitoxin VapB
MTVTINNPEADELVQELISYTGETSTEAVLAALRERLEREKEKQRQPTSLKEEILRIGQECAALPLLDNRSSEEIMGYNEVGVPS